MGLAHLLGPRDQHRLCALAAPAHRAAAHARQPGRSRLLVRQHHRGRAWCPHHPVHSCAVPALLSFTVHAPGPGWLTLGPSCGIAPSLDACSTRAADRQRGSGSHSHGAVACAAGGALRVVPARGNRAAARRLRKDLDANLLAAHADDLGLEMIEAQCAARASPGEPSLAPRQEAGGEGLKGGRGGREPLSWPCSGQSQAGRRSGAPCCQRWVQACRELQTALGT